MNYDLYWVKRKGWDVVIFWVFSVPHSHIAGREEKNINEKHSLEL